MDNFKPMCEWKRRDGTLCPQRSGYRIFVVTTQIALTFHNVCLVHSLKAPEELQSYVDDPRYYCCRLLSGESMTPKRRRKFDRSYKSLMESCAKGKKDFETFYFTETDAREPRCSRSFLVLWNWCSRHQVYFFKECPVCRELIPDFELGVIKIDG